MLVLSRVCAEFHDQNGAVIYRVTPQTRLTFQEVPDSIREDPLFNMLLGEGALEAAVTGPEQKKLEADPRGDTDAAGRKKPAAESARKADQGGSGKRKNASRETPEAPPAGSEEPVPPAPEE